MSVQNRGRLINFINGITGVAAGGQAVVNMPTNLRYHNLNFRCAAVNYTGGTAKAITAITGTGTGATGTLTLNGAGVPTAITIVAGGTSFAVGNTFTIADDTGAGFVATVATISGSAIATATVTVAGTATAMSPVTFFSSFKLLVNGINMRDIDPVNIQKMCVANGYNPRLGELPVFFTEPWRNIAYLPEATSWDLFGQSTFQIQMGINPLLSLPSLSGTQCFDYFRNVIQQGGKDVPFLQPIAHHQFSWPIVAGRNDINTLPFNFPIARMWLQGSTANSISQVEVFQDGNKPLEAMIRQLKDNYEDQGFQFGQPTYQNASANSAIITPTYNPIAYYDAAFIADPNYSLANALRAQNSMILRVFSDVAQTLTIVQETLPGAYA